MHPLLNHCSLNAQSNNHLSLYLHILLTKPCKTCGDGVNRKTIRSRITTQNTVLYKLLASNLLAQASQSTGRVILRIKSFTRNAINSKHCGHPTVLTFHLSIIPPLEGERLTFPHYYYDDYCWFLVVDYLPRCWKIVSTMVKPKEG